MKVERISENKVKITLTFEELESRDITLKDIERDNTLARELFIELLEEIDLTEDFTTQDSQLFIEASSDNKNLFIVTITRVHNMPELKKYIELEQSENFLNHSNKKNNSSKLKISNNVYYFSSIDKILDFCSIAHKEGAFLGRNSLYKYENSYFLIFNDTTLRNKNFIKTYSLLSEYCDELFSFRLIKPCIEEKCMLITQNVALQKIINKMIKK